MYTIFVNPIQVAIINDLMHYSGAAQDEDEVEENLNEVAELNGCDNETETHRIIKCLRNIDASDLHIPRSTFTRVVDGKFLKKTPEQVMKDRYKASLYCIICIFMAF